MEDVSVGPIPAIKPTPASIGQLLSESGSLTIEVKPKCGKPFIGLANGAVACRHCLHQHGKVSAGKWAQISQYCPLDLFSCDPKRVSFALEQLLSTPQNNFRVALNGTDVFSQELLEKSRLEEKPVLRALQEALRRLHIPTTSTLLQLITSVLKSSQVLQCILAATSHHTVFLECWRIALYLLMFPFVSCHRIYASLSSTLCAYVPYFTLL